jgi:hypothetical protein
MGLLIKNSDFVGTYEVPQTMNSKLDSYIARYETLYLKKILGVDLFTLFEADITNYVPTTPIYEAIFEPLSVDYICDTYYSEGLKSVLLNMITWDFCKDFPKVNSQVGQVVNSNENSIITDFSRLYKIYNDSVESIQAIQVYIYLNKENYPDFKGEKFKLNCPLF